MVDVCSNLFRKLILSAFVLIAVLAFLPDTVHLSSVSIDHQAADHDHDQEEQTSDRSEAKHCHTGVSCSGALDPQEFALPALLRLLSFQTKTVMQVRGNSGFLDNEPPVPIRIA